MTLALTVFVAGCAELPRAGPTEAARLDRPSASAFPSASTSATLAVDPAARWSDGALAASKLVDLTWPFDERTLYWPNAAGFRHRKDVWARTDAGYWYAAGGFSTDEHGGTHLDSPVHFAEGRRTLDAIPIEQLVGPAVVVDVRAAAERDPDHRVSAAEIEAWEAPYGRIEPGTIVFVRTGWGSRWPDRARYLGSDVPGDVEHLHFPGLGADAAQLLVERRVDGVGIDTASLDPGPSRDFVAHRVLGAADVYGLENVAQLERLPVRGATVFALPMKIAEGSGGPVRILAILP